MHAIPFRLARMVFWAALALYLGGLITLGAVAAPKIFSTLRESHEGVTAVTGTSAQLWNDPSHLGGEVFGKILVSFSFVEMFCLIAMGVAVLAESLLYRGAMLRKLWNLARIGLLVCVAGLLLWDSYVTHTVHAKRKEWRESGDWSHASPKWPAFDAAHKQSENIGHIKVYFLLGLLVVTSLATTTPPPMPPKKIKPAEPEPIDPVTPAVPKTPIPGAI